MRIGVSGHQDLGGVKQLRWVSTQIRFELDKRAFVSGVSSLAEGSDQIFAEIVLDLGKLLEVVIPCRNYETAFRHSLAAARFVKLKERASNCDVLNFDKPSEEAFFAAGRRIVEVSDVLLAVWDGKAAAGRGENGGCRKTCFETQASSSSHKSCSNDGCYIEKELTALFSLPDLRERGASHLRTESYLGVSRTASQKLANESAAFKSDQTYDIFLSHSALDAEIIYGLKLKFEARGLSVYVYWIEDPQARETVDAATAAKLKGRMESCKSLLYAASENASASKWIPWELGYFDGIKGLVAVVPLSRDRTYFFNGFKGQEYPRLYPYVSPAEEPIPDLWVWSRERKALFPLRTWVSSR